MHLYNIWQSSTRYNLVLKRSGNTNCWLTIELNLSHKRNIDQKFFLQHSKAPTTHPPSSSVKIKGTIEFSNIFKVQLDESRADCHFTCSEVEIIKDRSQGKICKDVTLKIGWFIYDPTHSHSVITTMYDPASKRKRFKSILF